MCTAATYKTKDFYFGRTLDYECSFGETVTVMPRNFPLEFRHGGSLTSHYAIIGMAHVTDDYPLYYDACNEAGLAMAGLNFVGNAVYSDVQPGKNNVAQFEFIPWVLSQCGSVAEARQRMENLNLVGTAFSPQFPASELHWLLADRHQAVTIESTSQGLHIYDNPVGVLTNNPPFPQQLFALNNYIGLSPKQPDNEFSSSIPLELYSRGMGALGLPGDLSSMSRFARAAFTRANSVSGRDESQSVSQFFHILGSVDQQRGCCQVREGEYEITLYTSCCNASQGIYYYTTYDNHQITAVDMHRLDLNETTLTSYPLLTQQSIKWQN